jgi:adenosylhomocysteine nucleosidase
MAKTILMVAAEAREFDGLLSKFPGRRLAWGLQFASETEFNGNRAFLVADGAGMQLAGAAADIARRQIRPDVVVSTGFCGGLDPKLELGDVLVASAIVDSENGKRYSPAVLETGRAFEKGELLSLNRVANTAEEKLRLRQTGARAVEMEAAAVAARALVWDVPLYCVRTVSDTASDSLGIDFNRMRDGAGRFSRGRIALSALARPWSRIPALLRLDRGCRKASMSLGDFLANCRF